MSEKEKRNCRRRCQLIFVYFSRTRQLIIFEQKAPFTSPAGGKSLTTGLCHFHLESVIWVSNSRSPTKSSAICILDCVVGPNGPPCSVVLRFYFLYVHHLCKVQMMIDKSSPWWLFTVMVIEPLSVSILTTPIRYVHTFVLLYLHHFLIARSKIVICVRNCLYNTHKYIP